MSLSIYDKTTGNLTVIASGTVSWIGSKAAHDAAVVANKMPNNVLVALLNTGLFYRDGSGVETPITEGGGSDIQVTVLPTAEASIAGKVVQYIGLTTGSTIHGYFYECVSDGAGGYEWVALDVQESSGGSIQVTTLNTPTVADLGKVRQYVGTTTAEYTHGYFYECVFNDPDYEWVGIEVDKAQPESITSAELAAMWND